MKLLLLHPLPLDGSIFSDDLRTLGDHCAAPTLYDAGNNLVRWADAALDAIGDGPIVVVGNSIGGSCAIEVARLAPSKVKALILCGSKPGHRREPDAPNEALQILARDRLASAWQRYWRPLFGPQASPDIVERAWRVAFAQGADAIADGVRAFHGRPDRERFIRTWQGPVFLVSGEHDINPEHSRRLALELPNATFTRVDGAGHYVPLEAPDVLTTITAHVLTAV